MFTTSAIRVRKSAALVMDFQNVLLNGYLSESAAVEVLSKTARLLAAARKARLPIIYVTVAFRPGHPEISARNRLFSMVKERGLFTRNGKDTAIHEAVAPGGDDAVVIKHRVGAFSGTDLETLLRAGHIETLILAGITTSGVVLSTTRQAFDRDYRLIVVRDCCADPDQEVHRVLLDKVIADHADVLAADVLAEMMTAREE